MPYPTVAPGATLVQKFDTYTHAFVNDDHPAWYLTLITGGASASSTVPHGWTVTIADYGVFTIGVPAGAAFGDWELEYVYDLNPDDTTRQDSFGLTFTVTAPPATPTGLTATPGSLQVALTWTAVFGVTTYLIERALASGGPWTQIGTAGTNAYTDYAVSAGTLYFYRVRSQNASGTSGPSSVVSATPTGAVAPTYANLYASPAGQSLTAFVNAPDLVDKAADDALTGYPAS